MRTAHPILAVLSLVGAGAAAMASATDPFDHGVWLVAYLFLVGFLAQLLLGRGQAALLVGARALDQGVVLRVLLWNAGVILVPLGVLIEARLFVVIGGAALLVALAMFWRSAWPIPPSPDGRADRLRLSQLALIVFMAASVFVGTALAWDTPWL